MKKQLILLGLALLSSVAMQAQETALIPLQVKSGFNADVVVEALPSQDYLTGGIDDGRTGFLVKGTVVPNLNDNGVPQMPATSNHGNVYNVDFTKNNALKLKGGGAAASCPEDGTVTFATPVKTDQLWVLGISGNGESKVSVTVNYSDGTSADAVVFTYEDWWNSSPTDDRSFVAFPGLDRIDRRSGQPQGVTSVHLDEYMVTTDADKEIVSVYIQKVSGADPNIMGFSTGAEAVAVVDGFNADIVAESPDVSATANYAVDDNDWCLYEKGRGIGDYTINIGLPEDGVITSILSKVKYEMNYAALNAVKLGSDSRTVTVEIGGAPMCEKIYFLGSTGNGPQTIKVVVNYTDGTSSDEQGVTFKDWWHGGSAQGDEAFGPLMRTVGYLGDYPGIDSRAEFWLYEGEVNADVEKNVESITLTATGGNPFVMGLSARAVVSVLAPLKVTDGFNADVVVEEMPVAEHLVKGIDNETTGFYKTGLFMPNTNDNGVPSMPAVSNNGNTYNVNYAQNNALKLKGGGAAASCPEDGTVVFAEAVKTAQLWVLGISGNGSSQVAVTVNYSDGTSEDAATLTYEDWWNSNPSRSFEAFSGLDRIDRRNGAPQGVSAVHLDEYKIDTNADKEIVSVYIKKVSGADPNIMGFSTGAEAVAVASGFNADIVAETPDVSASANYAVDDNDWCLYEKGKGIGAVTLNEGGLAEDGLITTAKGISYQMDYAALNAARLGDDSRSITLAIAGEPKCESLYFLGACGSGPQTIQVVVNYTDETTSEGSFVLKDWYRGTAEGDEAVYGLGRFYNAGADLRYGFRLYEGEVAADITKAVKSVTLTATGGTPVIMGVSGLANPKGLSPWVGSKVAEGDFYLYNVESGLWLQNNDKCFDAWTTRAEADTRGLDIRVEAAEGGYVLNPRFHGNHSINGGDDELYMDTGRPVTVWAVEEVADAAVNNAYTIKFGDKALGVDENGYLSTHIAGTWQFVSKAERVGALSKVNAANPEEVSWFIDSPTFANQDERYDTWVKESTNLARGGNPGGVMPNACIESWNSDYLRFYQTLTNLPNGTYAMAVQGFYRDGHETEIGAKFENGTETFRAEYYAGPFAEKLMSICNTGVTEQDNSSFAILQGGNYIPGNSDGAGNAHDRASKCFWLGTYDDNYKGVYWNEPIKVLVTDGTLTIGIRKNTKVDDDWTLFDNFKLTYYGSEYDQEVIDKMVAMIDEIVADASTLETTDVLAQELQDAINEANDAKNNNDAAALNTVYNKLVNAYNAAKNVPVNVLKRTVALAKEEGVDTDAAEDFLQNGRTADELNNQLYNVRSERKLNAAATIDADAVAGEEPVDGGKYYLLNVGTGLFFDITADWSTHMSIDNPGIELTFAQDGNSTVNSELPAFHISGAGFNGFNWSEEYFDKNGEHKWTFVPVEGKEKTYYMNVFDNYDWHVVYDVTDGRCDGGTRYWNALKKRNNNTYKNDVNAQWKLVTADERKALLDQATEENPVDATIFVENPNFSWINVEGNDQEKVRRGWEGIENDNVKGADRRAFWVIEVNGGADVKQTVTGLPQGKYTVSVNGYSAGANLVAVGSERVEAALPTVDSEQGNMPGIGTDEVASSYYDANEYFQTGLYKTTTDVVTVGADGQLVISIEAAETAVFDNFRLTYLGNNILLDEAVDNTALIASLAAKGESDVAIKRSTVADTWNTIVLPFDLTADQVAEVFGEGTEVAAYTNIEGEALQFSTNDGSITAATPYLIRPTKSLSADEPVVIKAVTATTDDIAAISLGGEQDYYVFTGIYDRVAPTKYDYFIAAGNKLKKNADETSKLKAFRAYFKDTREHVGIGDDDIDNPDELLAKIFVVDGNTDGIILEDGTVKTIDQIYTISGQKVTGQSLQSGVYVVNGKKVIVK